MKQYANSKLGTMLFSHELARQLDQHADKSKSKESNPVASPFMLFDKEVASDQGIGDCLSKYEGRKPRIICNVTKYRYLPILSSHLSYFISSITSIVIEISRGWWI
jgi:hypothetical protein